MQTRATRIIEEKSLRTFECQIGPLGVEALVALDETRVVARRLGGHILYDQGGVRLFGFELHRRLSRSIDNLSILGPHKLDWQRAFGDAAHDRKS